MSKKKPPRTTSFWMAIIAIFISLIGTGISVVEAGILRDQQQLMTDEKAATVWPFVAAKTQVLETEAGTEITFTVKNKGVGPALINGITYSSNEASGSITDVVHSIILPNNGLRLLPTLSQSSEKSVLQPGEEMEVYKLLLLAPEGTAKTNENKAVTLNKYLERMEDAADIIEQITIDYCYCSVYGDCWDKENHALTKKEACAGREMLRGAE